MQQLPIFLDSKVLISVIDNDILELSAPIEYKDKNTTKEGFKAEILPKICELYLKARRKNILNIQQKHLAAQSEILLSASAKVGITALADEATGYQDIRKKDALKALLDKYLEKEYAKWAKSFVGCSLWLHL